MLTRRDKDKKREAAIGTGNTTASVPSNRNIGSGSNVGNATETVPTNEDDDYDKNSEENEHELYEVDDL